MEPKRAQLGELRPAPHTASYSSHPSSLQTMGGLVSGHLAFLSSWLHCHLDRQQERGTHISVLPFRPYHIL